MLFTRSIYFFYPYKFEPPAALQAICEGQISFISKKLMKYGIKGEIFIKALERANCHYCYKLRQSTPKPNIDLTSHHNCCCYWIFTDTSFKCPVDYDKAEWSRAVSLAKRVFSIHLTRQTNPQYLKSLERP